MMSTGILQTVQKSRDKDSGLPNQAGVTPRGMTPRQPNLGGVTPRLMTPRAPVNSSFVACVLPTEQELKPLEEVKDPLGKKRVPDEFHDGYVVPDEFHDAVEQTSNRSRSDSESDEESNIRKYQRALKKFQPKTGEVDQMRRAGSRSLFGGEPEEKPAIPSSFADTTSGKYSSCESPDQGRSRLSTEEGSRMSTTSGTSRESTSQGCSRVSTKDAPSESASVKEGEKGKDEAKPEPDPPKKKVRIFSDTFKLKLGVGQPRPHGCSAANHDSVVNFSLLAPGSGTAWFILVIPLDHPAADDLFEVGDGDRELYVKLDPKTNKTKDSWHLDFTIRGRKADQMTGIKYAWLIEPEKNQTSQVPEWKQSPPEEFKSPAIENNDRMAWQTKECIPKPKCMSLTKPKTVPVSEPLSKPKCMTNYRKAEQSKNPGDEQPAPHLKRIIDPYAVTLDSQHSPCEKSWNVRTGTRYSPLPVVPNFRTQDFNWQGVKSPGYEMKDLIIYEAHVRGYTKNPDSGVSYPGTFLGFTEKIPYLLDLGVNCVELLPIFEFDETAVPLKNPHTQEQLCNYWGYSTVAFFVPMQRFASSDSVGSAIIEFKTLVRELHRNGIEVILDVVFNHTGEGGWGELNWTSWSQVALQRYYLMSGGNHCNYTGCGNTMNANDSVCAEWICECLRYWACEMHVDGFRFDLASSLTRGSDGQCNLHDPLLMKLITEDPKLKHLKLIAEPWDCAWPDGYLIGKFPQGTHDDEPPRWAEWNGEYRDAVRKFIKGDPDQKCVFATRLCGSADLYQESGRSPYHSINFITAHDGFTLRDLVSYNKKNNHCNGEQSGEDNNNSWDCVPQEESHDKYSGVEALRQKQQKNFLCALLLSHGTPMMTFGDEYGRSQNGCNNAWCQDALSWFSWSDCEKQVQGMFRFSKLLIALRKEYRHILNRTSFASEEDIWFRTDWDDPYNYISYVLHSKSPTKYEGLLVAFNSGHETYNCYLPEGKDWYRIIDTNQKSPQDICEDHSTAPLISGDVYLMAPYSCIVLKTAIQLGPSHNLEPAPSLAPLTVEPAPTLRWEPAGTSLAPPTLSPPGAFQEFQFLVHCGCSKPGEVVAVVGSDPALGSWDPMKAIVCTTSAEEYPIWSSPVVQVPVNSDGKLPFKLVLRGEAHVQFEEGENHVVLMPKELKDSERVMLKCGWGVANVSSCIAPKAVIEVKPPSTEFQFLVRCDCSKPGEVVAIVGSDPALGSWQAPRAILCTTSAEEFPMWSSPFVEVPVNSTGKFEFKLVLKGEKNVQFDKGENHVVLMPTDLKDGERVMLKCGWGVRDVTTEVELTNSLTSPDAVCEELSLAPATNAALYQMLPDCSIAPKAVIEVKPLSTEFQFLVHCDCSKPGEVVAIVGSDPALGSWQCPRAILCTTSAEEFPIWSSPMVEVPVNSLGKFEFKLVLKGEKTVLWEEGENHEVLIPKVNDNERVILKCGWGLAKVTSYLEC